MSKSKSRIAMWVLDLVLTAASLFMAMAAALSGDTALAVGFGISALFWQRELHRDLDLI